MPWMSSSLAYTNKRTKLIWSSGSLLMSVRTKTRCFEVYLAFSHWFSFCVANETWIRRAVVKMHRSIRLSVMVSVGSRRCGKCVFFHHLENVTDICISRLAYSRERSMRSVVRELSWEALQPVFNVDVITGNAPPVSAGTPHFGGGSEGLIRIFACSMRIRKYILERIIRIHQNANSAIG